MRAGSMAVLTRAKMMEAMLMKKLSMVSLKANQLSSASRVILAPLQVYTFLICISRNSSWTL